MRNQRILLLGVSPITRAIIEAVANEYGWAIETEPNLCHRAEVVVIEGLSAPEVEIAKLSHPQALFLRIGERPSNELMNVVAVDEVWVGRPVRTAVLRALLALRANGSESGGPDEAEQHEQAELRELFWARLWTDERRMATYFASGDDRALRRIGHQVAGSAASVGYVELTRAGRNLESAVVQADPQQIALAIERFRALAKTCYTAYQRDRECVS